jgi:hypothetical protein
MRPKYRVAAYDYPNQQWVYVGKTGLVSGPRTALVLRSSARAVRLAAKYTKPAQALHEALVFEVWEFVR